mmetsp:Transcript_25240/g.55520  ORF Transcript_25240/g.55520 Transcript_25240/m.55520 type:complete len:227 (+) Transcript_25240:1069-1749(+)
MVRATTSEWEQAAKEAAQRFPPATRKGRSAHCRYSTTFSTTWDNSSLVACSERSICATIVPVAATAADEYWGRASHGLMVIRAVKSCCRVLGGTLTDFPTSPRLFRMKIAGWLGWANLRTAARERKMAFWCSSRKCCLCPCTNLSRWVTGCSSACGDAAALRILTTSVATQSLATASPRVLYSSRQCPTTWDAVDRTRVRLSSTKRITRVRSFRDKATPRSSAMPR